MQWTRLNRDVNSEALGNQPLRANGEVCANGPARCAILRIEQGSRRDRRNEYLESAMDAVVSTCATRGPSMLQSWR